MQRLKVPIFQEIFGTGQYFWTLTMGRLVCQLARTSTRNTIYIKQGLISIMMLS